jgi:hypothetical protein
MSKRPAREVPRTSRYGHNDARRAERGSTYAIEPGKPSRKSTRKSSNRAKPDSALRLTARERTTSPEMRAARGRRG